MKNKKKIPAKKTRNNLDKRIAAAKSPTVVRYLAMYGQETPPTAIQTITREWDIVRRQRGKGLTVQRLAMAEQNGIRFFRDAMLQWDADTMIELGKEMKRMAKATREYDLGHHRRALLACGVSVGDAAEVILEKKGVVIDWLRKKGNEERELRRIKNVNWKRADK